MLATQRWGPELGSLRPRKKLGIVLTTPDLWEAEARESLGFSGFHIPQSMAWSAYVLLPHSEGPATDLEMSVIHTSEYSYPVSGGVLSQPTPPSFKCWRDVPTACLPCGSTGG